MTALRSSRQGSRRFIVLGAASAVVLAACPNAVHQPPPAPARVDTVTVKDPGAARLEVRLLEDEALLEDLQSKLDDARLEVVRAMAKLQSLATRAEAASGMAEAEIALDSLKAGGGQPPPPEAAQAARLLQLGTAEFDKQNYGGALYLANQAKNVAGAGHGRIAGAEGGALRPGEVLLTLPLRLRTVGAGNVREGPGAGYKVSFTVEAAADLVAYSYADAWLRVSDASGRSGWISYTLVSRRPDTK